MAKTASPKSKAPPKASPTGSDISAEKPQKKLGQADSTAANWKRSEDLFNAIRLYYGKCVFSDSKQVEFEEDNFEAQMATVVDFYSSRLVPNQFDQNLQPKDPNNKRYEKSSTLANYIGLIIQIVKQKFPTLPCFANNGPLWWPEMRKNFIKECDRFHLNAACEEVQFGLEKTAPLYRRNDPINHITSSWEDLEFAKGDKWHSFQEFDGSQTVSTVLLAKVDLHHSCLMDMKESCHILNKKSDQNRLMKVINYLAAGRGGEIKFQDYSQWIYDWCLELTDIRWSEAKTLTHYAMPMVPDACCYSTDFYHALGCYWAVSKGLLRFQEHMDNGTVSAVFPDLHTIRQDSVAGKVTTAIRSVLPKGLPPKVVASMSSKSLRGAAVTTMSIHPQLGIFEVVARSGHSTGVNIDHYSDKNNIHKSLPAAKVLSGWQDVNQTIFPPRLEAIGDEYKDMVFCFVKHLFPNNVGQFQPNGPLFPVFLLTAASLIMYFNQVEEDLGAVAVVVVMKKAARKAKIHHLTQEGYSPECTLSDWSDKVYNDWLERNYRYCSALSGKKTLATTSNLMSSIDKLTEKVTHVHHTQELMQHLKRKEPALGDIQEEMNGNFRLLLTKLEQIKSQNDNEIAELREQLQKTSSKLAYIRTPTSSPQGNMVAEFSSRGNKKARLEAPVPQENQYAAMRQTTSARETVTELVVAAGSKPMTELLKTSIVNRNEALKQPNTIRTSKGLLRQVPLSTSQKGISLSHTLFQMIESGVFAGVSPKTNFRKLSLPPTIISNKHYGKNCLELVQYTLTPDQYTILATPYQQNDDKEWYQLTNQLEKQALDKMWVFEGSDPEEERASFKKKRGPNKGATVVALGSRVNNYKLKIWEGLPPTERPLKKEECKLCERDQIRGPGTPKDNKSMRQFLKPIALHGSETATTSDTVAEAVPVSHQDEHDEDDVVYVNATPQRLSFK